MKKKSFSSVTWRMYGSRIVSKDVAAEETTLRHLMMEARILERAADITSKLL